MEPEQKTEISKAPNNEVEQMEPEPSQHLREPASPASSQPSLAPGIHRGQKVVVQWGGRERELVDGFGLCSPTLWHPSNRSVYMDEGSKYFCAEVFKLVSGFVEKKFKDPQREAIRLGLGHISASPFTADELESLRNSWSRLLPSPGMALEVPDRQPFFLGLIGQSLEMVKDPDFAIYMNEKDSFWSGVPVGFDEPLPRTPEVFPKKEKIRPLDESEYNNLADNYKSARELADDLEKKFREEERLGRMMPTTLPALQRDFPERTPLVAAMGAIRKPNGDVRPLHDGTHFVQLNNQILFQDQLQYPGPEDAAHTIRQVKESQESLFGLSADIASAHRLVLIRKADWPLLACKARSEDKTVWVNCVGTFGVSSASYWWTRLFAGIGRLVSYIMQQQNWYQLVYVDDLHLAALGPRKFLNIWTVLLIYEILGTPFSYAKFSGGLRVQFVGYLLDYRPCLIGITQKRGEWLVNFVSEMQKSRGTVLMRRFNEFLGRLGFVARVLVWLKPFLAPLYSWSSALGRSSVATAPRLVMMVLEFLKLQLSSCTYMHSCLRPRSELKELFRTDAKCENGRVVLGGVHLLDGRWFALEVSPSEAPFLFKGNGESQWASTTAELLAVLFALHLFGFLSEDGCRDSTPLKITAGTDNLANEHLLKKGLTTKWPLCLVFMQMTQLLMKKGLVVQLNWRPRDENSLADALTNLDFRDVDAEKRINCKWNDVDLGLLWKLWTERETYSPEN